MAHHKKLCGLCSWIWDQQPVKVKEARATRLDDLPEQLAETGIVKVAAEDEREVVTRVGELVSQREVPQRLLAEALHALEAARAAVEVIELQLESLKALGSQPRDGAARRVWRALASPAVATIVAITAIPVGASVGIEAAEIQARATLEAANDQSNLDDNMAACIENTEDLIEALGHAHGDLPRPAR